MIVRLSLLDAIKSFNYDEIGDIALAGDTYEIIGTCTLTRNDFGEHFGELNVSRELDEDLFFYYTFSNSGNQPWFTGIQLNKTERKGSPTTRLKEMIVK
jgi:hypothetical protein